MLGSALHSSGLDILYHIRLQLVFHYTYCCLTHHTVFTIGDPGRIGNLDITARTEGLAKSNRKSGTYHGRTAFRDNENNDISDGFGLE